MFDAFYIGATGMQAQQLNVDTIANNLSNVNTTGFKKSRVSFSDLVTADATRAAGAAGELAPLAARQLPGAGVAAARVDRVFDAGDLQQTGAPLDVAIRGSGLFEVVLADDTRAYSRGGHLKVNADGQLATAAGQPLRPGIQIPANAQAVTISASGQVSYTIRGRTGSVDAGQLELVRFANPAMLQATGDGLYRATPGSGEATTARPGQDDSGQVVQGAVEASNVKLVDEMVNLMVAQRAYEASVKVVQAADEMMGMVNNLRK